MNNATTESTQKAQKRGPAEHTSSHGQRSQVSELETSNALSGSTYDRGLGTRTVCITALALTWLLGAAALAGTIYTWRWWQTGAPKNEVPTIYVASVRNFEAVPLAINTVVTFAIESTGLIHATSLRWILHKQGKLAWNSNLRLLSCSPCLMSANGWPANALNIVFLVLSYSATSLIFFQTEFDPDRNRQGPTSESSFDHRLVVNPVALLCLAIGLLGQSAISTWALLTTEIPTWSSNPFDTLVACKQLQYIRYRSGRCMMSVADRSSLTKATRPQSRQPCQYQAHSSVKYIALLLWALTAGCLVWGGTAYAIIPKSTGGRPGTNWSLLPIRLLSDSDPRLADLADYQVVGYDEYMRQYWTLFSPSLYISWERSHANRFAAATYTIILLSVFQSLLTLSLHGAELLVSLHRDESVWRRAASRSGAPTTYNSIRAAATSWATIGLFLLKAVAHWLYGLAASAMQSGYPDEVDIQAVLRPAQIFYLGVVLAVLAGTVTGVCFWRPKGAQPAAYGHLQTLADLADEWAPVVFWGHKGKNGEVCAAGTAPVRLSPVSMDRLYGAKMDASQDGESLQE